MSLSTTSSTVYIPVGEYSEDELLNVKFAGVAVGSPERSEKWLERTLLGERVWFTLLDHTPQQKSLSSIVHTNKHKVSIHQMH